MSQSHTLAPEILVRKHRELQQDLLALEACAGPHADVEELRTRLGITYTNVCEHFRLEEQEGYLAEVRRREPELDRTIQALRDEHGELRKTLDVLHAEAGLAIRVSDAYRKRILQWVKQLREHEIRENELVQDAFDRDVGTTD